MTRARDDFTPRVRKVLADRVAVRCSRCEQTTSGPNSDPEKSVNIGVAAHITAAAPGGPRYDASLSSEERKSAENGVWLCQTCAKLIDNDPELYPVEVLRERKRGAEARASALVSSPATSSGSPGASPSASLLAGEVDRLATQMSGMVEQDLDRMILAWREGRTGEAINWIEETKGDETRWRTLLPQLRSRLLRFEASVSLNATRDVEKARKLADEARAEAPMENDTRLRAVIAYVESGPEAAIELLADQKDIDALNLEAGLLLETIRTNRAEECRTTLAFEDIDLEPNAETFRVRALSYLISRDLDRAQLEIQKAKGCGAQWESVRFTAAMIDYLSSLSPAALSVNNPVSWPEPVDWHLIKRDDGSTARLRKVARTFEELATSAEEVEERKSLEIWRLACLANDPEAQEEAVGYCQTLLEADPAHYRVVLWVIARGFDVDLRPSEFALEELIADGPVEFAHVLALTSCYFASDRSGKAVKLLDKTQSVFQEARAGVLWNFWYAQALTLTGDPEGAVRFLDEAEPKTDLLRAARTVALRSLADRTNDWAPLVQHLEASYEETGDAAFLATCCEVMAQQQDWPFVADRAEELVEEIGTDEALRLAAIAAYYSGRSHLCLKLLDEHRDFFGQHKLPDDLRRIRALSQSALGVLPEAIVEAEALVEESPKTPNLIALAQLYFAKGDLKSLAVISRRLNSAPDLPPESCLELSRLVQLEDRRLAASLWRKAVSQDLPDPLVGIALSLGFQLNLEEEASVLQARMMELASRGEGGVQLFKASDIFSFLEEQQKQMAELNELYRGGRAPVHLIAERASRPLLDLYHGILSGNERSPAPMTQPLLFVRHGGRGSAPGFPDTLVERRLNLDVTAVLLAAHLGILPAVEGAFGPLRIPADLIPALVLMVEKTTHHQPSKFEESRQVVELAEEGSLQVVSPELQPERDVQLVEELGDRWVAIFEEARKEDGYLLDFLPLTKLDLSGPPSAMPEDAGERLVNCRSLLEVLHQQGQLSDGEYSRALSRLGEEGRKDPSSAIPEDGSILYCDGSIVELLAGVGLLRAACRFFRVRVEEQELGNARATLRYQERAREQIDWLNDLIDRLRDGVDSGTYEIIPVPPHENGDPEVVDATQLDFRCLETLFFFEAEQSDVVWADDRMVNSYPARNSVPIISIIEVLQALVGRGTIEPSEYYDKLERLRAANVRFVPFQQDEILYHLRQAEVRDTSVVESRPLRTLRRYVAACLTRSDDLQRPPMPEGAPNQFGEIEFIVSINRVVAEALIEVWKAKEEDYGCRVRSEWLLSNMYLDLPTLARITWAQTTEEDDSYRLAVELSGLVIQAMQLDLRGTESDPSPRRRYLDWLYERVLSKRFEADRNLIAGVADSVREYLIDMREEAEKKGQASEISLLLGLFYSDLAKPLQKELSLDADLMESISIRYSKATTIGEFSFDADEFGQAASEAVNGRETQIVSINHDAEVTFAPLEQQSNSNGMRLVNPDGDETEIKDDILVVLSNSAAEREAILHGNGRWFDCSEDEFQQVVAEIASNDDPQLRLDETEAWRSSSAAMFYTNLHDRLAQYPAFELSDLRPPDAEALVRHLRIVLEADSDEAFLSALGMAATALVKEEGLFVAIERLAGLPVSLPTSLTEAVAALSAADRRSLFRQLLKTSGSPPSKMHIIRLLNHFSEDTEAYFRLARRMATQLFTARGAEEFEAFAAVLKWVSDDFDHWSEVRFWAPETRLAMVWAHTHRLFAILMSTGATVAWIKHTFNQSVRQRMTSEVFEREPDYWFDVTHPRRVNRGDFLLAGISYGFDDNAQRFGNEASLENVEGLSGLSLLRDPTLARNRLNSFLGGDRGEKLSHLLGPEQTDVYSRQALKSLVEDKLANRGDPEQEHLFWASIYAVIGDLPPYDELASRLEEAIQQTDFVDLAQSNTQTGMIALHAASQLKLNVGNEDLRGYLKEQLVSVTGLLAELDSSSDGRTSAEALMEHAGLSTLMDTALAIAIATSPPEEAHPEFASLIDQLVSVWPTTASLFKLVALRLCEELPVSQSKHYWPLLLRLRAE